MRRARIAGSRCAQRAFALHVSRASFAEPRHHDEDRLAMSLRHEPPQREQAFFIEVARARSGLLNAIQSGGAAEAAAANAQLTGALGRLLVTVENYPQLKSDQNFLRLQDELAGTENRIAVARTDYNSAVNQYNAYIRTLLQKLTAMVTGAKPREYFNAPEGTQAPPTVDFSPSTS